MSPFWVGILFVTVIVSVCLFDIWLTIDDTKDNTISSVLRAWFKSCVWLYYSAALILGTLISHWGPV